MKVLVKENLGADFTANVISSCNQNGLQAIADYTHDEILFYDPQNHLYCRHSELIRNSGFDVFKMFKHGNENMRFDVMNPTEGDGFRDFATDWNALQRKDGSDVMKTKNCEMIRVEPNKIEEKTMRKTGESDKPRIVGNRKPRKEFMDKVEKFRQRWKSHDKNGDDFVDDFGDHVNGVEAQVSEGGFKPIDSAYLDDGEGMDVIRGDDWYGDSDNYDTQERWERRARIARKMGKRICWRCGSMFKPDGDEDMCQKCQKTEEQHMSRNNSKHENVSESDDPRDWSASEGDITIRWLTDFPDKGIYRGDIEFFTIDYDLVDTHSDLVDEVVSQIEHAYSGLDFGETDFKIVNEDEFWDNRGGNPGMLDEMYSEGKFETMADIDDEQVWDDVGIDDNDNIVEGIPNWATCYIMYGDDSGLTPEDVAMVDKFVQDLEKDGLRLSHPISGSENEFNSYPAFGDACDTEDWSCEVV